ncbi:MAG: hypothetical protein V2B15_12930 [Bacteroidota bacterium]
MPVGNVSPEARTNTIEGVSTPGVKVLSLSLSTGMMVKFFGILYTLLLRGTACGSPAGIVTGWLTLSGWIILPLTGTGTPVIMGSPKEFIKG